MDTVKSHIAKLIVLWVITAAPQLAVAEPEAEGLRFLSEQEVLNLLSGATLYGKYTDGRLDWAEQTAVTGQLFDVADDWREVGSWTMIADMVCYRYVGEGNLSCFDVYESDAIYYFYTSGTENLVAYTTRIDRPPMM